jgi:uncharacterized RDD family membrane protein YckC
MSVPLKYETPENVQIEYRPAGLGTRFIAWFVDQIILNFAMFLLFILLVIIGAVFEGFFRDAIRSIEKLVKDDDKKTDPETIVAYFVGIGIVIWGLGSFFYFGLSELLWRGQTVGKRMCEIRVVKADGFALDTVGVFIRNIFRVIDHLPILWVVPALSNRGQRFGDMVAGTIVVTDASEDLAEVRDELSSRPASEARFRFDHAKLARLSQQDVDAIERVLDRWNTLSTDQRFDLLFRMVAPLCKKMQIDEPPETERAEFLQDLLAAEYRRQDRHLR